MNNKNIVREIIVKNKVIFFLLTLLLLIGIGSGITSKIPSNKLDKAKDSNAELLSKKEKELVLNEELKSELKNKEKKQFMIKNKLENLQSDSFEAGVGSIWKGTSIYYNQPETELILEINEHNVVFNFGPTSENLDLKKGSFYMGKNVIDEKTGYIELLYTEWKEDPGSYNMENLYGVVKNKYMTGILTDGRNNKIGEFKLEKIN